MRIDKTLGTKSGLVNSDQSHQAVQPVVKTAIKLQQHPVAIHRQPRADDGVESDRRRFNADRRLRKQRTADRPVLLDTRSRYDRRKKLRRTTIHNKGINDRNQAVDENMQIARGIDAKA